MQVFIMMNGFSQSGKTFLAKKIAKLSPSLVKIDTSSVHDFLNHNFSVFSDDQTIQGKKYDLRQKTTKAIQNTLLETLVTEGFSVILDTCNLKQEKRKKVLDQVKELNKEIKTLIIQINIPEKQLLEQLKKADQEKIKQGLEPAWIELYQDKQKKLFEAPQQSEADELLIYNGNNQSEILDKIKSFIK